VNRKVSPLFAVLVALIAVAIGFLYFMWRLRAYDAAQKAEAQMLQAQADAQRMSAIQSGTYGRMGGRSGGRRAARGGAPGQRSGAAPGGPARPAPGAAGTPAAAGAQRKPEGGAAQPEGGGAK